MITWLDFIVFAVTLILVAAVLAGLAWLTGILTAVGSAGALILGLLIGAVAILAANLAVS